MNEEICKKAIESLSDYRKLHSFNVAKCARSLAELYNADVKKAYLTGLVHDVTKEFSEDQHIALFNKYNFILDDVQKATPKLWHSISGALFVKYVLKEDDDDVYNAIRFHTTGRSDMSLLEKIIFVSDFVSEERNYGGVDKIREVLKNDGLDACALEGLAFSINDLSLRKKYIHNDTLCAYNQILKKFN
ncbi:MAG: bis(5'-nucleosyl)-tetraphosphatase (symmetrical) YqeK [Clostridia bacterium]|nr:bis(5'-nucleosyl)-tetraphosphatase (symmetrical) YqeK [Clostridia bacterium]